MIRSSQFCLSVLLLAASVARADGPNPAALWLESNGQASASLALVTDVEIEVTGLLAHALVRQQFLNDTPEWAEGRYVFPLPDDVAVESLRVVVGDRVIEGEVRERVEARLAYEQARAEGRIASLVEQGQGNLFSTRIANIAPGQLVEVQIGFRQRVEFAHGEFRLRFPFSMVPPYRPASTRDEVVADLHESDSVDHLVGPVDSINPVSLKLRLDAGMPLRMLESSHHAVRRALVDGHWLIDLDGPLANPHKDFELVWRAQVGAQVETVAFRQALGGQDHVLLMFNPPEQFSASRTRREVTLIIDTSGSMQGESIEQARQALELALGGLDGGDRFNLIEFNGQARELFPGPVPVTPLHLREARSFIRALTADGGTEMRAPLEMALAQPTAPGYLAQLVFVTDGQVANTAELLALVRRDIADARLFTVGIGHGVNSQFLSDMARLGRGSSVLIADLAQVAGRMNELLTELTSPVLHDIELHWPNPVEALPARIPDLYTGQPLVLAARMDRLAGDLLINGFSDAQPWQQVVPLETFRPASGVAAHWGRQAVQRLLDQRLAGADPEQIRAQVVELATEYQLLSPYTSLVAVDRTPERSRQAALQRYAIPGYEADNRADNGGEARALMARALPATDAGSDRLLIRGLLALLLVILVLAHPWLGRVSDGEQP